MIGVRQKPGYNLISNRLVQNHFALTMTKNTIMKLLVFLLSFCYSSLLYAQPAAYHEHIAAAENLYKQGDYAASASRYSAAFEAFGWKGYTPDRFNAARSWAMAGVPDSAYRIAEKAGYDDLDALTVEPAFSSLRAQPRWAELCQRVKANQPTMPELSKELQVILVEDQRYRSMMDSVNTRFGWNSDEMQGLLKTMIQVDSANTVQVSQILDTYGWLGDKEVGIQGNQAIFLVIQHADIDVQEKYLPMMRDAQKAGKARGADLALLEDRVLMRNGKKQIYGSQLSTDSKTNQTYFFPIEDVDRVDERRAAVGLQPMAEYAQYFGITWDAATIEDNKKRKVPPAEPRQKH